LAGIATIVPNPESVEKSEKVSQTEGSWDDLQQVKENLKKVTNENDERKKDNEKLRIEVEELKKKLTEEQADHVFARQELDRNAQRVLAMLGTPQSEHTGKSLCKVNEIF
jgi:regulator of replication initiation timing